MKILITGSNGMLGSEIVRQFKELDLKEDFRIIEGGGRDNLNILDYFRLDKFIKENKIDGVINCAAYTNVEQAELDRGNTYQLNVKGPTNLSKIMKEQNGFLIHFSTDYVYGFGYDKPIKENTECKPVNFYGLTKYVGEKYIEFSGLKDYIIFRTSWLYGKNNDSCFPKKILNDILLKGSVNVVNDQIGTPTNAKDLASAVVEIVRKGLIKGNSGIYNYSGKGKCSWFEFAKEIVSDFNGENSSVFPCSSFEFKTLAKRPFYSVLNLNKFSNTFKIEIPEWNGETLKNFISSSYKFCSE